MFFTSQEFNIKQSPNATKLHDNFLWARRKAMDPGAPGTASLLYKYPKNTKTLGESTKYSSSHRRVQNTRSNLDTIPDGVHHLHCCLSDDAWVVLCRPLGPYLVSRWLHLSLWILNTMVSWRSIWCNSFCGVFVGIPWTLSLWLDLSFYIHESIWVSLISFMHDCL